MTHGELRLAERFPESFLFRRSPVGRVQLLMNSCYGASGSRRRTAQGDEEMATVTIRDVASAAGVAVSTASRALNNRGDVSESTRRRVLQAARELDYVPNSLARGLLSGRTRTVGVIVTTILNPFYAAVVAGIQDVLGAKGYNVVLYNSDEDQRKELAAVEALIAQRVDGIILAPVQKTPETVELLVNRNVPFVLVGRTILGLDTDYVVCDDIAAGQIATEHLIKKGHRQIMLINSSRNSSSELRYQGYAAALRANGIEVDSRLVRSVVLHTDAERAVLQALDEGIRPTAIFCFCDAMALGVLRALRARGLRVPDDVALVACDNLDFTEFLEPALTTIDVPKHEMGVKAAEVLLSKLHKHKKRTTQVVLRPSLVARAST